MDPARPYVLIDRRPILGALLSRQVLTTVGAAAPAGVDEVVDVGPVR